MQKQFHRTEILVGTDAMNRLINGRVILFGVGGVGGPCAEALIRSGIGHLTLVDSDLVCITNVNRQIQAVTGNVGAVKVDALTERLRAINPNATIEPLQKSYTPDTKDEFDLESYDVVLDSIDSLYCKVDLLTTCIERDITVFSSMGAACKMDPGRIKTGPIWETMGCPLAKVVRRALRKQEVTGTFDCVYSDESVPNQITVSPCGSGDCFCPKAGLDGEENEDTWCAQKASVNGSLMHMTASFGLQLAWLAIRHFAPPIETGL
jgi:tRNA A37 threonylcarbamoyladenosine dehydratase